MEGKSNSKTITLSASALLDIYNRLLHHYGPQHWWPAQTRFEVIVGAILTQSVSWPNVEMALLNLKSAQLLDPAALNTQPVDRLAELIRPSGYYNAKARKIKAFVAYLHEHYQYSLDALFSRDVFTLRKELLSIHGIGPETADCIILYAAGKPKFVIDAYTKRLLSRLGLVSNNLSYDELQAIFENNLPCQTTLFNEYHALIVRHARCICRKMPMCADCPLFSICKFGKSQTVTVVG